MKVTLVLFALCICVVFQGALGRKGFKAIKAISEYTLSKRNAQTFSTDPMCGGFWSGHINAKEGLRKDCCGSGCSWEERCEYAEWCGWHKTGQLLCELSIKEGNSCTCQARAGFDYECSSQSYTKECLCETGSNLCDSGRKCFSQEEHCNSDNNCGNWKDEEGCTITEGQRIELESGIPGVSGNVLVGGRPVCDHGWNDNAAKAVCKILKIGEDVAALSTTGSFFGEVATQFRMNDVQCQGNEDDLSSCRHTTISKCNSLDGAGVHCIKPTTLDLTLNSKKRQVGEGFVNFGQYSACLDNWDWKASQIICNQYNNSEVNISGNIPVFAATGFDFDSSDRFVIQKLGCTGKENYLTECPKFSVVAKESCKSGKKVKIQCAKCLTKELVDVLQMVEMSPELDEIEASVLNAQNELKRKCYNWDCSKVFGSHPFYCKTKATLDDLKLVLENRRKEFSLTNKFNELEELKHNFIKSEFGELQDKLKDMTKFMTGFQKSLSKFFYQSAEYQRKRLESEITSLRSILNETVKAKTIEEEAFEKEADNLIHKAKFWQGAKLLWNIFSIIKNTAELIFEENPKAPKKIIQDVKGIVSSSKNLIDVNFLSDLVPRFAETTENIAKRMEKNQKPIIALNELLRDGKDMNFTKAKTYVTLTIKSPYNATDLADIQGYLNDIVNGLCNIIKNIPHSAEYCHNANFRARRVIATHRKCHDTFLRMANYIKEIAKTKLQVHLSQEMAATLKNSLGNHVTLEIAKIQSTILIRLQKIHIIEAVCQKMKYMNHNKDFDVCTNLRKNMDGDLTELMGFDFTRDMCKDSSVRHGDYNIPISFEKSDSEGFEFDLTKVFQNPDVEGQIYFRIPDNNWLLTNGWINKHTLKSGLFFLKRIQLVLPPIFKEEGLEITTTFSLIRNAIGNDTWNFKERKIARTDVSMNSECDEEYKKNNPYNLPDCPKNHPICVTSDGTFSGPIYPSLVNSLYRITFEVNKPTKVKIPLPTTKFYLKARVEFCFNEDTTNFVHEDEDQLDSGVCCGKQNNTYHSIENVLGGGPICQECPPNSKSVLYGYCCVKNEDDH